MATSGCRWEKKEKGAGSYARNGATLRLVTSDFQYPSGPGPTWHLAITFAAEHIATLTSRAVRQYPGRKNRAGRQHPDPAIGE